MKKIIFLVAALIAVFSGVAAVSAYEGHMVDVKAHVENAIGVSSYEVNFGTVFPEEQIEKDITIGLSSSFMNDSQTHFSAVNYELAWELKPAGTDNPQPPYLTSYYQPINPYLTVTEAPPFLTYNGTNAVTPPGVGAAEIFATGQLWKTIPVNSHPQQCVASIHLALNVPVFAGYYNSITDPLTPSGILAVGQFVTNSETLCDGTPVQVPSADMGIDLKIQVTGFVTHE